MQSFNKFLQSFNTDASKGRQFEVFVKWFLENDPEWSTQVDKVWLWDEYPDRWGADCGVDLIFKHNNGETWAVQAKCYDTKYSITKKDVDTFLSESNRQSVDKRLLISSTDQVGKNARQVCQAQEKQVVFYLHSDFNKSFIEYPDHISKLSKAKIKDKPTPREHQNKAINDVIKGFENNDRGQMIMACGTGKTFTTLWAKERLKAKTTLVLLPSLSLLSQTLREWTFASRESFEALCVCSDETVGKSIDELVSSTQDVAFPTTSEPEDIRAFLKRDVHKVVFSTYHSSSSIAEAQSGDSLREFDLVIADEAHRCTGEAGKAFTTVLDGDLIKAKKRLFTTATPKTYSSNIKKKASDMGVNIADMSDESLFGKVFHNLTFGQAIEDDLLTDYRVVVIGVDEPMVSDWIKKRELVKTGDGDTTDAKSLAAQIGLIKAIKDYDLKRMISFHSRVKGAKLFAEELHSAFDLISSEQLPSGEIYTDFVSGEMSSYDRGLKLSQLKELPRAERGLLTNARCLSEGVDVPSLDGVAFIDPRSSQVDIIQAVGRAIRKSEDKTTGTIILPVFIEDIDNVEESLQSSNFKPIWGVINALKSHDESLSLELNQMRTNLGRQGGTGSVGSLPDKIVFDLPQTISGSFSDALRTITVDKTTSTWEFWYGLLCNYIEENQSIETPDKCIVNGFNLGAWIQTQRTLNNKNNILPNRRKQLDDLGFIWDALEHKWNKGYSLLKQYIEENGSASIVKTHKVDGFNLGSWAGLQRVDRLNNSLSPERRKQLDDLGFIWDTLEHKWNKGYSLLKQYIEENGDALVPALYEVNDFKLGGWVSHRRKDRNNNMLSSKKIQELDELGFIWDVKDFQWHEGLDYLKQYIKDFRDTAVPQGYKFKGYSLGHWVNIQKRSKSKGELSSGRISELNDLNFIWDTRDLQWNKGYEYLKRYFEHNGNTLVHLDYETDEGFRLGKWVAAQRTIKNLAPKRVQKLNDLGFIWSAIELKWAEGYNYLKRYFEINENSNVPNDYVTNKGFRLGAWVSKQRQNSNKMSLDRREKLNDLDFIWDARRFKWNQGYENLKQYFEDNGDTLVPRACISSDGYKLGFWVGNLRHHKNRMTEEQIQKLDGLGFVWSVKK